MDMDEDDTVVQEIDIFLSNPKHPHYLLQYPIRSQPFNEFNLPIEARIKPNAQMLELDLSMNTRAITYDKQKADELAKGLVEDSSIGPGRRIIKTAETLERQTLSSSLLPQNGNYMFGLVKNDGIHFAPISALLQLRPNFNYLDRIDKIEKLSATKENDEEQEEPVSRIVQMQVKKTEATTLADELLMQQRKAEEEPWTKLQIYMPETEQARNNNEIYTKNKTEINYTSNSEEYVNKLHPLCPSTQNINKTYIYTQGLPLSDLNTLPLLAQLKSLMLNAYVLTYDKIISLIKTTAKPNEILSDLEKVAVLIKGNWVVKSELSYKHYAFHARQYLLSLFKHSEYVNRKEFGKFTHIGSQMSYNMFSEIGVLDGGKDGKGWQLKLPENTQYEKENPNIVNRQNELFKTELAASMKVLTRKKKESKSKHAAEASNSAMDVDEEADDDIDFEEIIQLSPDILPVQKYPVKGLTVEEQLDNLLMQLFKNYGVLQMRYIIALVNVRQRSDLVSNKIRDNITPSAIKEKVEKMCEKIHNSYILKSLGDRNVDGYRKLIVNLFKSRQSIQKSTVIKTVLVSRLEKIPLPIYNKILKELAVYRSTTWTLKTGIPEEVYDN